MSDADFSRRKTSEKQKPIEDITNQKTSCPKRFGLIEYLQIQAEIQAA